MSGPRDWPHDNRRLLDGRVLGRLERRVAVELQIGRRRGVASAAADEHDGGDEREADGDAEAHEEEGVEPLDAPVAQAPEPAR